MATTQRTNLGLITTAVFLAAVIFLVDLSLPLGVAGGVPYVGLVLLGWWFQRRRSIHVLAAIASALTVAGYFWSPEGGIPWVVLANRFLALLAIWVVAVLMVRAKLAQEALQSSHTELEQRVKQRTKKLTEEVAERARAEDALRESEERFRAVVDNSPTKIHIKDLDGRYTLINRQSEILFGVTNEEARGKTSRDIFSKEVADSFAGHDQAVIDSGQTIENEEEWVCDDGVHTFLTVKFPIPGATGEIIAVGAIGTDITERKRAEEALRESEQRFKDVAEATSDWFWEMDENLRFTFFSGRRQQLIGLPTDEYIGRTRWEVADANPDDDEKWRDHRATLEAHEPFRDFEVAITTKDGRTLHNKVSGRPVFDANGVFKGYRGAATDVAEQIEAQAQLIQASKLATLGEMASGIAHELNQPLSVVGMAAELSLMSMEEGEFDTEFVHRKLETIVGQKERMAKIVNHMRLFSRKDKGNMETFNPVECVAGAIGLIDKQFQASGVELEEDIPATCRYVSGHPLQLEQVVLNLLTNARDAVLGATESAGPGKGGPAAKVRVSVVDDKRRKTVVISVADNGGGIPKQVLERIFDPFFTTKTEGDGTGLGLSISYSIIDAMGGRLEARNAEDGARLEITLPVSADGPDAADRRSKGKKRKPLTCKPHSHVTRVLFVDDEEAIGEEVAEYLRHKGYDVAIAGNGLEALEFHQSRPADIVITDLIMPDIDGNELMRRLRQTDPELPIVVVTGHTTFDDEKETVTEGASVVLRKPIKLRELSDTLNDLARF